MTPDTDPRVSRAAAAPAGLARTISLRDLVLLVVGAVIGSGIFIVPASVLRQVDGSVSAALLVWLIAGVLSLLGALTYGELGAARPHAGGLYVFLRDAFGPFAAFLFGWTTFLVLMPGTAAALAVAFATYFQELFALPPVLARAVPIAMLAVIVVVNVLGTRGSVAVQNWSTAAKAIALLCIGGALLFAGDGLAAPGAAGALAMPRFSLPLLSAMGAAMIGVLWAYEGWQWATYAAGETADPQRTIPRGLVIGTATLVLLYCLAVIGYVAALGPTAAMESDSIAAAAVAAVFGTGAGRLVAAAILVSIFSAANATVLTAPRVFFAMASDGVFFRSLARIHPRFGTPAIAISASGLWAMVLAATGTFDRLLTYVVFTGWVFYGLAGAAIFVFRRRDRDAALPFRCPGYPVTPLLFVGSAAAIVVNALFTTTTEALIGLAFVASGAPAYLIWRRGRAWPAS